MRDLRIRYGDLSLVQQGQVDSVKGVAKIHQDLLHRLANLQGYNRFHPWLGAGLDNFVGKIPNPSIIFEIRRAVRSALDTYMAVQRQYIEEAIEIYEDPIVAIRLLGADGIVRTWESVEVTEDAGDIYIAIQFQTVSNVTSRFDMKIDNYSAPGEGEPLLKQYLALQGSFTLEEAIDEVQG